MKRFFLSFVWLFFFAFNSTSTIRVSSVSLDNTNPQTPFIIIQLDAPPPHPDYTPVLETIDDETLVLHFPIKTQWAAKRSEVFGGLIKSFTYVPYEDGTGDLVFKVSSLLQLSQSGILKNNSFGMAFHPRSALNPDKPTFIIRDVKIGPKDGKTRLVFEMNEVVNFTSQANKDGTKIILTPSKKPLWQPKFTLAHSVGRFEKYKVHDVGKELSIELFVLPGTTVSNMQMADAKSGSPKLIIDLGTGLNAMAEIDILTHLPHDNAVGDVRPDTDTIAIPGLVKKMDFISQEDDTIVRLETTSPKDFEVIANTYLSQAIIQIPKTDWKDVVIPVKKAGLIQSFRIDQTSPTSTKILVNLQKGTAITGKKVFSGENGLFRFVVYFNQNENKTPSWLVEETTEQTSYRPEDLEVAETSRLMYQGGISPYTNVGEGFYMGLQLDQISGQNSSNSINNITNSTRNLSTNNFGGGGHLYLGYGLTYNRFYGGLEFRIGGYGAEEKDQQQGANNWSSSSNMGLSWDITTRLGGYISPTSLLYARLGVISTNFSYSGSSNADGVLIFPGSFTRNNRTGFLFGLGLESAMTDQSSLRLEGAQINYQGIRYNTNIAKIKNRNIVNQVSLGVSYKTSPMSGPPLDKFYEESINTGFYFGLASGMGNMMDMREVQGKTVAGAPSKYLSQSGSSDPTWELFGGYGHNYNRFFIGTEMQMGLNPTLIQESIGNGSTTTESYSNKVKWLWAATVRPGYIFNHGTIGYGRLGIAAASLVHKASSNSAARLFESGPNMTKHIFGIRTGGGLEAFITPTISLRADYTFDYFPRAVFSDPTLSGVEEKITLINNEFKIGVTYSLPS